MIMLRENINKVKSDKGAPTKIIKKKLTAKDKELLLKSNPELKETLEQEKNKTFVILEIIEYVPNSVVNKTIIKKTTGDVTVSSFDSGEALTEKKSPFDTFIQAIEGKAEVVIDGKSSLLDTGQSIIIPAHTRNVIKGDERFKIISTVIKSGYDEVSV